MRDPRISLSAINDGSAFDVVVVGAGGAGLSAALSAAIKGARVLIVERTGWVGGTTAFSAGTTWVPGNHHGKRLNPNDTLTAAARYLDLSVGDRSSAQLRQAFLDNGARVVEDLEAQTELKYRPYAKHPDYISDLDGATLNGRALEPLPFDGRLLGALFGLLRPPIPEFTVLGGMMVDRNDVNHLLGMRRSVQSFKHAMGLLWRHACDRVRYPRGTRLVMGNALVARLLYSLAQQPRVSLLLNASLQQIHLADGEVQAVTLLQAEQTLTLQVRGGLVLASGGFNRHPGLRGHFMPGVSADWCPGAPGHTGQAHDLARKAGAIYGAAGLSPAYWAPVSLRQRADGSLAVFPHFVMDRAKPGMLTVNQAGQRFVNESTSYHLFALAMQAQPAQPEAAPAYLVCDARALKAYGLGMVRPGAADLGAYLADGYLSRGATLQQLASQLGIDGQALQSTVARFNTQAMAAKDSDFHRGTTAYERNLGDPAWGGDNPNLGPLLEAPFYAVKLYPGDIGAATGFMTDAHAQVLGDRGEALSGLYAVGNDMHSIMGGVYPAPGITLGPGLVFGYLAAEHAVARAKSNAMGTQASRPAA